MNVSIFQNGGGLIDDRATDWRAEGDLSLGRSFTRLKCKALLDIDRPPKIWLNACTASASKL